MPFYIAVYDVNVKRGAKVLKLFRRYMTWVQNSVFEGDLTRAQFERLRVEADGLIDSAEDSVLFYELRDERYTERISLGTNVERGTFF